MAKTKTPMKKIMMTSMVKTYSVNGNEEDTKFVEIDGAKFEADETDATKPKLDDKGEKVPFVEKAADDTGKDSDKSIEDLAKDNPAIQKLLDAQKQRDADDKKREEDAAKAKEEEAKKTGEWQKLAEERGTTVEQLKKDLDKKEEILGKYVSSTKQVLKQVMDTIPKENHGLIPENFSPREKLEYITKNAKLLGAKVSTGAGAGVDANDTDLPTTDEGKLVKEFEDLQKKENKTSSDYTQMEVIAKKIKEVRAEKK